MRFVVFTAFATCILVLFWITTAPAEESVSAGSASTCLARSLAQQLYTQELTESHSPKEIEATKKELQEVGYSESEITLILGAVQAKPILQTPVFQEIVAAAFLSKGLKKSSHVEEAWELFRTRRLNETEVDQFTEGVLSQLKQDFPKVSISNSAAILKIRKKYNLTQLEYAEISELLDFSQPNRKEQVKAGIVNALLHPTEAFRKGVLKEHKKSTRFFRRIVRKLRFRKKPINSLEHWNNELIPNGSLQAEIAEIEAKYKREKQLLGEAQAEKSALERLWKFFSGTLNRLNDSQQTPEAISVNDYIAILKLINSQNDIQVLKNTTSFRKITQLNRPNIENIISKSGSRVESHDSLNLVLLLASLKSITQVTPGTDLTQLRKATLEIAMNNFLGFNLAKNTVIRAPMESNSKYYYPVIIVGKYVHPVCSVESMPIDEIRPYVTRLIQVEFDRIEKIPTSSDP